MNDLNGQTAVITGGATGIGFGLAKAFGARGASVVIAEPRLEVLERAVAELKEQGIDASFKTCDVREPEQVAALADFAWGKTGHVEFVLNNAGIGFPTTPIIETDLEQVRKTFEVNFFAVYLGCKVFGKRLVEQGSPGSICNTGSENALFVAVPQLAGYVASKHAVHALTASLREEMPDHVHVGLIIPGFVKSGLTERVANLAMDADEYAGIVIRQILDKQFYIVSHAYNMVRIDERHAEIEAAYKQYAPRYEGDDEYDVRTLMQSMR